MVSELIYLKTCLSIELKHIKYNIQNMFSAYFFLFVNERDCKLTWC